jgi:hypothetical protein
VALDDVGKRLWEEGRGRVVLVGLDDRGLGVARAARKHASHLSIPQ